MSETPPANEASGGSFAARVKRTFVGWGNRLRRVARWATVGAVGTLSLLSFLYPEGHTTFPVWVSFVVVGAAALLPTAFTLFLGGMLLRIGRFADSEVEVSSGELLVRRRGKVRRYELERFASGIVVPRGDEADIHLRMVNDNELVLRVRDLSTADALLEELGLGATRRRTETRWTPVLSTLLLSWFGMSVASMPLFIASQLLKDTRWYLALGTLWMFLPWWVVGAIFRFRQRKLAIGLDGVMSRKHGRTRAWSFERMKAVRRQGMIVTFVFEDREETLVIDATRGGVALARAIEAQVGAALEAFQQGEPVEAGRFIRPEGESFDEWVASIKSALRQEASFRSAPMRPEEALRVVEDPRAPAEARVAAALALSETASEEAKLRVRVASESTVRPKVRVALRQALEGDVEERVVEEAEAELRELEN